MHTLIARLGAALAASCPTLYARDARTWFRRRKTLTSWNSYSGYRCLGCTTASSTRVEAGIAQRIQRETSTSAFPLTTARRAIRKLQMMQDLWAG